MLSVVVDVGGTNIRLGVLNLSNGEIDQVKEYLCSEFTTLENAIEQYFVTLPASVAHLCIGIACPVEGDEVKMVNFHWQFSQAALKNKFALKSLYVINDYTAISLAVPFLDETQQIKVGGGSIVDNAMKAVFGPGTGLGVSHLIKQDDKWISLDGEGGHISFAPNNRQQAEVLLILQEQFGHVSTERLLSGQGIVNIYQALCKLKEQPVQYDEAAQITTAAVNNECEMAEQTLNLFCQAMGSFAGNLVLNLDCRGGVYIAGGIVPRFLEFFENSEFRQYFEAKGRLQEYLSHIPAYVITHKNPGLLGAAVYLRQELS
ncbi:glucokinase [Psychromonas sp. RZ22]|uniref:glucokinase n=1 Tax=Psychromonas algarum TaxID=2555643 RepID=UPI0010682255|nr:glucokinase [Psychromonas sp. RZ22]TEW56018.1 glucokinase [Psychromonas sp. RZ22]